VSTTFTATIEQVVGSTSRATVRTHTCLVDRGRAKGGNDLGPAGGEYMLVSLGGCFTSHLIAALAARDAEVSGVRVAVSGTLDGTPERFTSFTLDVSATCADRALLEKSVTIAGRGCQVTSTLRQATTIAITCNGASIALEEGG